MVEKKKSAGFWIILGAIILVTFSLIIGVRGFLERTRVFIEQGEIISSEEGEEELRYLKTRLRAKLVLEFQFREKSAKELLAEISKIKTELEEVKGEGIREVFREDRGELEKELLELEKILKREEISEGDKQLEFIEKVTEYVAGERIKYFVSRVAFSKDEERLEESGVFLLNGAEILLQEREEGVNVFLGGESGVGMTTEDLEKIEKREGEIFSVEKGTGKKIKIGEGLEEELKKGKLRAVRADFSTGEIKTTEITLRGKATWDLEGELEARGITGLVGEAFKENNIPATLEDSLERLEKSEKLESGEKAGEGDAGTTGS